MRHDYRPGAFRRMRRILRVAAAAASAVLAGIGGCDALNPAFVETVLPADFQGPVVTENAKGHIPVFFVNNTQFEGELLQYLKNELGVDTTDPDLRPRVRLLADVLFADGSSRLLEFLDGSTVMQMTDPKSGPGQPQGAVVPPDLDRPPLTNQVLQCDVVAVAIQPQSIEVFVPVFVTQLGFESVTSGQITWTVDTVDETFSPRFWPLQMDEVDERLTTTVVRNIGIRDMPGPILDLACGSVIMFRLEGAVDVPFLDILAFGNHAGWRNTDQSTIDLFPGRYRMVLSVR